MYQCFYTLLVTGLCIIHSTTSFGMFAEYAELNQARLGFKRFDTAELNKIVAYLAPVLTVVFGAKVRYCWKRRLQFASIDL